MIFRHAELYDVRQMQIVRHLVKENVLSDPSLVPDKDVAYYICEKGKGWVCEIEEKIVGFSIVDLQENSVWALFVHPLFEQKGIGKKLHDLMLDWYFQQTSIALRLGTAPATRAALFYELQGWKLMASIKTGSSRS